MMNSWNASDINFKGDVVSLRKLSSADCTDRYLSWLNDPEVNKYSGRTGRTFSMMDVEDYIEQANKPDSDSLLLGIFWSENSLHIGNALLGPIDEKNSTAEISNMIGEKDYWGKGVAVDADKMIIHYAFAELKLNKMTIGNIAPNRAATFLTYQLGFKLEGKLRNHVRWQGDFVDELRFGLLKDEFYLKYPDYS